MKPAEKRYPTLSTARLQDAFKSETCPICTLTGEESKAHLRSLYYEFANDATVRDALHRSRGFCNRHAWESTEIPCADTGISIIYNALFHSEIAVMREILGLLEARPTRFHFFGKIRRKKDLTRVIQGWMEREACLVCTSEARTTLFYLRVLIDHFHEKAFREKFRGSAGLCLPHLRILVEKFPEHPSLPRILEIEIEKYQHLSWELSEYWRKHDYRFSHEPMGEERDSWLRAVRQLAGMPGHFGNDVARVPPSRSRESLLNRVKKAIHGHPRPDRKTGKAFPPPIHPSGPSTHPLALEVKRALKQAGCPICRIGDEALKTNLSWLLKQDYDSPSRLTKILEGGGFCRTHAAWIAAHGPDYAGSVMMEKLASHYEGAVKAWILALERGADKRSLRRLRPDLRRMFPSTETCVACQTVQASEAAAIRQLVNLLAEEGEKNRNLYAVSDGLCARHFTHSMEIAPQAVALFLARDMERRLEALTGELRGFLKQPAFSSRKAPRESGRKAWLEGLTRLYGNPKVE